jgi:hypothetical protein
VTPEPGSEAAPAAHGWVALYRLPARLMSEWRPTRLAILRRAVPSCLVGLPGNGRSRRASSRSSSRIARDWNATSADTPHRGFVTRFRVRAAFAGRYEPHTVGAAVHRELWVPAEELEAFNANIVGRIEVVAGGATTRTGFGEGSTICMAPAPHVDGDPAWGLARSRRRGPSTIMGKEGLR